MGGRNLGDAYHRSHVSTGRVFQDTDILAKDGRPECSEHVAAFQALWDSVMSVDVMRPDSLDTQSAPALEFLQDKAREVESLKPDVGGIAVRELPNMDGRIVNNLPH